MKIVSVAIQKGGAGKTTTTLNLGAALLDAGKKCLLIDLDPQASLSQSLGIHDEPEPNVYHLLKREAAGRNAEEWKKDPPESAILERSGLDIVPASLELASAELELVGVYGREQILSHIVQRLQPQYDFVLVDCPPSIGMLTVNALVASDYLLMPLLPEFLSLKGAKSFLRHVKVIRNLNGKLSMLGFVLTHYDGRKTMTSDVETQLQRDYGADQVFKTHIRSSIALAKAQQAGVDIFSFDKSSNGATDYGLLAREFLSKTGEL